MVCILRQVSDYHLNRPGKRAPPLVNFPSAPGSGLPFPVGKNASAPSMSGDGTKKSPIGPIRLGKKNPRRSNKISEKSERARPVLFVSLSGDPAILAKFPR